MLCRSKLAGATGPVLHGIGRRQVDVLARARSCLHWTSVEAPSGSPFLPSAARQYRADPRKITPTDADSTIADTEVPPPPDHTHRTNTVVIGPLGSHMDDARLKDAWSALGRIADAKVYDDDTYGELLRYGTVKYRSAKSVDVALLFDGKFLGGHRVHVRALFRHMDTVFVNGLALSADEAILRSEFESCGEILDIRVGMSRLGDRTPRVHALIKFADAKAASRARNRDGMWLDKERINVTHHVPQPRTTLYHAIRDGEPPSNSIRVSKLPPKANEVRLKAAFEPCGEVAGARVVKSNAGSSLGFAYVTFKSTDAVDHALQLDGEMVLDGYTINITRVPFARYPKPDPGDVTSAPNSISIQGLTEDVDDEQLRWAFEPFGEITECRVLVNRLTRKSRGYGFVTFASPDSAAEALEYGYLSVGGYAARVTKVFRRPTSKDALRDPASTYLAQLQSIIRRI
ncbi:unnamed protein product [Peniophora sp. CBMAI 1063]|nr:unnamed protein product [Peniophora sp. CBMAI 1063]